MTLRYVYITGNGTETTEEALSAAYRAGTVRLVHSHGNGKTLTSVHVGAADCDTRGKCFSVWDEMWTTRPTSLQQVLTTARARV